LDFYTISLINLSQIKKLVILLFLQQTAALSQNQNVDSLKFLLKNKSSHDTTTVKILNLIGEEIYTWSPDSAIYYWEKVVGITEKKSHAKIGGKEKRVYLEQASTALNNIGYIYQSKGKPLLGLHYLKKSLQVAKSMNDQKGITNCLNNIGFYFVNIGNTIEALNYYNESLTTTVKSGDSASIIASLNLLADLHVEMNDYTSALNYYKKSLNISYATKNLTRQAQIYTLLGNTYFKMNKIDTALKYDIRSLELYKKLNNTQKLATCYNNIGARLLIAGNFDKALVNFNEGLSINERVRENSSIHVNLNNIGTTWLQMHQPAKANSFFFRGLDLAEKLADNVLIFNSYERITNSYLASKDYGKAQEYGMKALILSKQIGFPKFIKGTADQLYNAYIKKEDYKRALDMHKLSVRMRDSINNIAARKASVNSRLKYEYEIKAAADSVKAAAEKKLFSAKSEKEKIQRYALYGGIFLIALFALFMFNRYKKTNKQKLIIEEKEKEAQEQKKIVEEKNKEILDSINYAKRLQDAILPSENNWKQNLPDSFILYKPKDIVAGDFYWMESFARATDSEGGVTPLSPGDGDSLSDTGEVMSSSVGGGKGEVILIAAADCTGHGVPGALVSVVCSNALNRVVKEFGIKKPNEILDKVKTLVIETFEKSEKDVKDGMDISLCALRMSASGATLHWAGANNPIWLVQNGVMMEIKGDKQPIGKHFESKAFTLHTIELNKNDSFYIFTDGFADQFGGPKGKKFKYKQLQKLLLASSGLNPESQKQLLNTEFENWKKELEQVDDICIIGVRI